MPSPVNKKRLLLYNVCIFIKYSLILRLTFIIYTGKTEIKINKYEENIHSLV